MHQTVVSYVCFEGQWYQTVFDPVSLVVSRVEGVAILPSLAALPHSPLHHYLRYIHTYQHSLCRVGRDLTRYLTCTKIAREMNRYCSIQGADDKLGQTS